MKRGSGTGSVFEGGFSYCGTISVCDFLRNFIGTQLSNTFKLALVRGNSPGDQIAKAQIAKARIGERRETRDRNRLGTDVTVASGHCNYFYFPFL